MDSELAHQISPVGTPNLNQSIEFASFGALAVQIWEFANSFFDEVEYLCRSRFTIVKSLYLWSRYVPLVGQIVNIILTHKMYQLPPRPQLCVGTFVYKAIAGQQALTCIEIILLIRVYALYNRSRRIKYFLCAAFLANFSIETWSTTQIIRAVTKGKTCFAETISSAVLVTFGASASLFQGFILCMTLFKYIVGQHYGWARTPLTSLLLRQGIVVCFLTFGMVVVNIAYESIRTAELELTLRNAAFAWYMCLLSVAGCRLILDMRKLAVPHPELTSDEDYDIELTSNLDLSPDSTLACHN